MRDDPPDRPDLIDMLRPLVDRLRATEGPGNDLVNMLARFIQQHAEDMSSPKVNITGVRVEMNGEAIGASLHLDPRTMIRPVPQLAGAHGSALPATVEIEPAVLKLTGGEVTVTTGSPPMPATFRWRQDLAYALLTLILVRSLLNFATMPFPEALDELIIRIAELLLAIYPPTN